MACPRVTREDMTKAEKFRIAIANLKEPEQGLAVRDERDRIVLEEGLAQRLSKIKKPDPSDTEKSAIAEKIFESVDRKSAEPKRRAKLQKGADRSKQLLSGSLMLTPEESRIMESPNEILLVHTPDGRLKCVSLGREHNVTIPSDIPQGSILSHNHPGGIGPSSTDLNYVLRHAGNTLRIVSNGKSGKELYRLKTLRKPKVDEIEKIVTKYETVAKSLGDTRMARLTSLSLILEEFGDILSAGVEIVR